MGRARVRRLRTGNKRGACSAASAVPVQELKLFDDAAGLSMVFASENCLTFSIGGIKHKVLSERDLLRIMD